jgi:hypothetical protein
MANGDITYSRVGGESVVSAFAAGSYIGLATEDIDVICGFFPAKIVLKNVTSKETCEWVVGQASTYVWLTIADGTRTFVQLGASGVESPVVMTTAQALVADGEGFKVPLGTTTAFNTTAEVVHWEAYR